MDLRQTALNTLGRASAERIGADVCQCSRGGGLRHRLRGDQRSSGPVGGGWPAVRTGFVDAEPPPSRFPAPAGRPRRGRVGFCNNFLLTQAASRAALHVQIGG